MLSGTACKTCSGDFALNAGPPICEGRERGREKRKEEKSREQNGKEKRRKRTERKINTARRGHSKTRVFGPARATERASSRRDNLSRHTGQFGTCHKESCASLGHTRHKGLHHSLSSVAQAPLRFARNFLHPIRTLQDSR